MSKEKDAFIEDLKEQIGYNPTEETKQVTDVAEKFYRNLRNGKIVKHLTTTLVLYTQQVLPELSMQQVMELTATVHSIMETVLTYLVEDGLIKEE